MGAFCGENRQCNLCSEGLALTASPSPLHPGHPEVVACWLSHPSLEHTCLNPDRLLTGIHETRRSIYSDFRRL